MESGFYGFPPEIVEFFIGIKLSNNAAWFEQNRAQYERTVRKPMTSLVEALEPVMHSIDPQLDCRPARAIARIRRDTRFSTNKDPYRDHIWFVFRRTGESTPESPGFYFGISASDVQWGCGFYIAPRPVMDALRSFCSHTPARVLDVVESDIFRERFSIKGTAYKRMAVPDTLPDTLRPIWPLKDIYTEHSESSPAAAFQPSLPQTLASDFQAITPFYQLLRDAVETAGGKSEHV